MTQERAKEPDLIEKSKLHLVLPSFLNLQEEEDNTIELNLREVLKSCMLQIFCQLEQYSPEEKADYYKWLATCIFDQNSGVHSFINRVQEKNDENATVIEAIRKDIINHLRDNHKETCETTNTETENEINTSQVDSIKINHCSNNEIIADGFLYENARDLYQKHDWISKYRCNACGSTNTKPLEIVSHSASTESLIQLFTFRLPDLNGKKLLDIGSGIGSILYGAFYFSKACEITGIELNFGFCKIVDKICTKYGMKDRIKVVEGDLKNYSELLIVQDVVVVNNAFEYFLPKSLQIELWGFIRENMKPGSVLVTNPDLCTILSRLNLDFVNNDWASEMPAQNIDPEILNGLEQTDERFHLYAIK